MAKNVVRKRVEFNEDTVTWFTAHYPEGSLSATVSMLLDKFKEVNTLTPADYAKLAAEAFTEGAR